MKLTVLIQICSTNQNQNNINKLILKTACNDDKSVNDFAV